MSNHRPRNVSRQGLDENDRGSLCVHWVRERSADGSVSRPILHVYSVNVSVHFDAMRRRQVSLSYKHTISSSSTLVFLSSPSGSAGRVSRPETMDSDMVLVAMVEGTSYHRRNSTQKKKNTDHHFRKSIPDLKRSGRGHLEIWPARITYFEPTSYL